MSHFKDITSGLCETLESKNSDYGNSFDMLRNEYGMMSTLIRLGDKLNRLKTLTTTPAKVDESIEDTLLDLAGYCCLELNYRKEREIG